MVRHLQVNLHQHPPPHHPDQDHCHHDYLHSGQYYRQRCQHDHHHPDNLRCHDDFPQGPWQGVAEGE